MRESLRLAKKKRNRKKKRSNHSKPLWANLRYAKENPDEFTFDPKDIDFGYKGKKTPQLIQKLLEAIRLGATFRQAAKSIPLSSRTFAKWRHEDPALVVLLEKAKLSRVPIIEDSLFHTAAHGNVEAQKFFLKNRDSKNWRDKTEHEHTGDINLVYGHRKPQEVKKNE